MTRALLWLMMAGCLAPLAFAQTASVTTLPNPGAVTAGGLTVFDVTATRPLTLRRISTAHWTTGAFTIQVWMRPGGVGNFVTGTMPMTNWTMIGSVQTESWEMHTNQEIPLDINQIMMANETIAIALVRTTGAFSYFNYVPQAGPYSNADLSVNVNSWGGNYIASASPPFSTYPIARAFHGTVTYDAGPTVMPSVTSLPLANTTPMVAGAVSTYNVAGALLTEPTTITAPAGIEVSLSQTGGFSQSVQIAGYPTYGNTPVYVRVAAGMAGNRSGLITHSSAGSPTRTVAVSGSVIAMSTSVTGINLAPASLGSPGPVSSYHFDAAGLVGPSSISVSNGFLVALNPNGPWSTSIPLYGSQFSGQVHVRLSGTALGVYNGQITHADGPTTIQVALHGETVPPYNLRVMREGPGAMQVIDSNSAESLMLLHVSLESFTSGWTVNSLVFQGTGTALAGATVKDLVVYEDHPIQGNRGVFDGLSMEMQATAIATSFSSGFLSVNLYNPNFPPNTKRHFYLMARMAGGAAAGQELKVELTGLNATTGGTGFVTGVPTEGAESTLKIAEPRLSVYVNGPVAYTTVLRDSQGDNNSGYVICDFKVTATNNSWNMPQMVFHESGTMNGQTAVNFLGLYVDNGNGRWDGPAVDTLATNLVGSGFNGANGTYTANLTPAAASFGLNQTKTFFLVSKMSGTATPGQTMRISIEGLTQFTNGTATVIGLPTTPCYSLVVDIATLTVGSASADAPAVSVVRGEGASIAAGHFRLTGSAGAFTVNGLRLATGGTGDWGRNLSAENGVQIYADNGNGTFDSEDTLLSSTAGANGSVTCMFSSPLTVALNSSVDLWVVLNTLPSAGASPAETFEFVVADAADIMLSPAGANRVLGASAPRGELRVVDFRVDSFSVTDGEIRILGSGFAAPVSVTIGGVPCTGEAVVNENGTMITGLEVPAVSGANLPVVLETNGLAPKQLEQTFGASQSSDSSKGESSGCVAGAPLAPLALLLPLLGAAVRRRREE